MATLSLPLEMQVGEMPQTYHPYKSPQGETAAGNANRGGVAGEPSWEAIPTGMPE